MSYAPLSAPAIVNFGRQEIFDAILPSCRPNALSGFLFNHGASRFDDKASAITVSMNSMKARFMHFNRRIRHLEQANLMFKKRDVFMRSKYASLRGEFQTTRSELIEERRMHAVTLQQLSITPDISRNHCYRHLVEILSEIGLSMPIHHTILAIMSHSEVRGALVACITEATKDKNSPWSTITMPAVGDLYISEQGNTGHLSISSSLAEDIHDKKENILQCNNQLSDDAALEISTGTPDLACGMNNLQTDTTLVHLTVADCPSFKSMVNWIEKTNPKYLEDGFTKTGTCNQCLPQHIADEQTDIYNINTADTTSIIFQATPQNARFQMDISPPSIKSVNDSERSDYKNEELCTEAAVKFVIEAEALASDEGHINYVVAEETNAGHSVASIVKGQLLEVGEDSRSSLVSSSYCEDLNILRLSLSDCGLASSGSEYSQLSAELTEADITYCLSKSERGSVLVWATSPSNPERVDKRTPTASRPRRIPTPSSRRQPLAMSPRPTALATPLAKRSAIPPRSLRPAEVRQSLSAGDTQTAGLRVKAPEAVRPSLAASVMRRHSPPSSSAVPSRSILKRPVLRSVDVNRPPTQHGRKASITAGNVAVIPARPKMPARDLQKRRGVIMTQNVNIGASISATVPVIPEETANGVESKAPNFGINTRPCTTSPDLSRFDAEIAELANSYSDSDLGSLEDSDSDSESGSEDEQESQAPTANTSTEQSLNALPSVCKAILEQPTKANGTTTAPPGVFPKHRAFISAALGQAGKEPATSSSSLLSSPSSAGPSLVDTPICGPKRPALFGFTRQQPSSSGSIMPKEDGKPPRVLPPSKILVTQPIPKKVGISISTNIPSPREYKTKSPSKEPKNGAVKVSPAIPSTGAPSIREAGKSWMAQSVFGRFSSSESKGVASRTVPVSSKKSLPAAGAFPSKPRSNTINTLAPMFTRSRGGNKVLEPPSPATKPGSKRASVGA